MCGRNDQLKRPNVLAGVKGNDRAVGNICRGGVVTAGRSKDGERRSVVQFPGVPPNEC